MHHDTNQSVIDLMATYYIFDIAYKDNLCNNLFFFSVLFLSFRTNRCFLQLLLVIEVNLASFSTLDINLQSCIIIIL